MKKSLKILISLFLLIGSLSSIVFAEDKIKENVSEEQSCLDNTIHEETDRCIEQTTEKTLDEDIDDDSSLDSDLDSDLDIDSDVTSSNDTKENDPNETIIDQDENVEKDISYVEEDSDSGNKDGFLEKVETSKSSEEQGTDESDKTPQEELGENDFIKQEIENTVLTSTRSSVNVSSITDFWNSFNEKGSNGVVQQINLLTGITGKMSSPFGNMNERTNSILINGNNRRLNIEFSASGNHTGFILKDPKGTDAVQVFHLKNVILTQRNVNQLMRVDSNKWKIILENVTLENGLNITYASNVVPSEIRINRTQGQLTSDLKAQRIFIEEYSRIDMINPNVSINGISEVTIDNSKLIGNARLSTISRIQTHHLYIRNGSEVKFSQADGESDPLIYVLNANQAAIFEVNNSSVDLSTQTKSSSVIQFGSDNRYEGTHYSSKFIVKGQKRKNGVSIKATNGSASTSKALINFAGNSFSSHSGDGEYNYLEVNDANLNIETRNNKAIEFKVENSALRNEINISRGNLSIVDLADNSDSTTSKIKSHENTTLFINVNQDGSPSIATSGPGILEIFKENSQNKRLVEPFVSAGKISVNLNSGYLDVKLSGSGNTNSTVPLIYYKTNFNIRESKPFNYEEYGEGRFVSKKSPVIEGDGLLNIGLVKGSKILFEGNSDTPAMKVKNIIYEESTDNYTEFSNLGRGSVLETTGYATDNKFKIKSAISLWDRQLLGLREPKLYSNPLKLSFDTVELSGRNLAVIVSTDRSDFTRENYSSKGFADYSRVVIESYKAVTEDLIQPTDADKYIYGKIKVQSGIEKDKLRLPYANEVRVNVEETKPNNQKVMHYGLVPQGMDTPNAELYPVYDKTNFEDRKGYFRIEIPGNNFALAGSKFKITKLYRYSKPIMDNTDSMGIHTNLYNENNGVTIKEFVTKDVTPPQVTQPSANGSILSGTVKERNVSVSFAINGVRIDKVIKLGNSLNWSYDFIDEGIKHGDIVQVFLEDANKNMNPVSDKTYHDAKFKAGAVHKFVFIEYGLTSKNGFVSLNEFNNTEKMIKDRLDAKGKKTDLGITSEVDVKILSLGGLDINNPKVGEYVIKLTLEEDESILSTAKLNIVDADHLVQTSDYVIYGNDFYANNTDYKASESRLISKAIVEAYQRDTLAPLVVKLEKSLIGQSASKDPYGVKFNLQKSPSVKLDVNAYVLDYDSVNENRSYVIAANDFKLMSYQVNGLSDEEIIKRADAIAFRKSDGKKEQVKLIDHNISSLPSANYKATFGINK